MYTVIPTARFEKDIKYYIKKKRYFHIGEDIRQITNELQQGHLVGTEIPGLKISDHGHVLRFAALILIHILGNPMDIAFYIMLLARSQKSICLLFILKRMIITFLLTMKLFL